MINYMYKKEDGTVEKYMVPTDFVETTLFDAYHLCAFDCINSCENGCSKMMNMQNEMIDSYEFITNGFQIFDEEGNLEKICVFECNDYVRFPYNNEKKGIQRVRK